MRNRLKAESLHDSVSRLRQLFKATGRKGSLRDPMASFCEETGYTAKRMTELLDLYPSPGFISKNMVIALAQGLAAGEADPEEDEKITQRICTLQEVERWIRSGKIRDMKTVAAVLYYAKTFAKK